MTPKPRFTVLSLLTLIVIALPISGFTASAAARDTAAGAPPFAQPLQGATPAPGDIVPGQVYTETPYLPAAVPAELLPELTKPLDAAIRAALDAAAAETGGPAAALNSFAFDGRVLTIDLEAGEFDEGQWSALLHTLDLKVSEALYAATRLQGLTLEYRLLVNGKPLEEILPPAAASPADAQPSSADSIAGQKIVLNPGHGYYKRSDNAWYLQRSYYYGIVEDFINLDLAVDLNRFVLASGGDARPTRQTNKNAGNHSTGHPWWQMDASEYIRSLGAPQSVWLPLPYSGNYDHDIAARPEYGNWIAANSMVSVHNNGSGGAACNAHGTETWYDTSNGYQSSSLNLANAIHGKLIQRIRERWDANWCDRGVKGSNGAYGENRRFRGPAVIVELAFMDVQSDNTALQNATFRAIAMAAINEALVQYHGGVSCPAISGWRGEYWNNRGLSGYPVMCRNDANVSFNWGSGGPGGSVLNDQFSARWTRSLSFGAGRYRFSLRGDDGIRLWVDGALVIDQWRDQGPTTYTVERDLTAGTHSLKVEYYENGGGAEVSLGWELVAGGGCPAITAWKGEYWNNRTLSGSPVLCRDDANVNFNWGSGGPGGSVGTDNFSARWTRSLSFSAGRYRFSLRGDDGIRLWVDGSLIIDAWRDQGPTTYTAERDLSAGAHSLKVEYYENGGGAEVYLWWETINSCTNQYRAEYFNNRTLSGSPTFTRCENWPINWDWGSGGPGSGVGSDNFSVRWTGTAYIASGSYTFIARTDDGMRVWLDDALVIDAWRDQAPTEYRVTRSVSAGNHAVKVEFYENGGGATAQFRWEAASGSGNLALGRPATATSYQGSGYEAYRGNDGSSGTRWSSRISTTLGDEWWWLDLGSVQSFNRVVINWEAAYAAQNALVFSNDQQTWYWFGSWTTIGGPGRYTFDFGTVNYRYVGVAMHARAPLMNNYSFWEYELYRNGESVPGSEPGVPEPVPPELVPDSFLAPASSTAALAPR